jgi:hypothetical protein
MNQLMSVDAVAQLIRDQAKLSLAGPESALDALPKGNWIGGTIPYFMLEEGGKVETHGYVFVSELPEHLGAEFNYYDNTQIGDVVGKAPANGFTMAIVTAGSRALRQFAEDVVNDPNALLRPTIGWVAGIHLSDLGTVTPKIYHGPSGMKYEDGIVVAHVTLSGDKLAAIEIVNIFEPDDGDVLRFDETGFEFNACRVNGSPVNLANYLKERHADDGKLPLVGDFAGAYINVSIQSVDPVSGKVRFYAPVFPGVDYRLAKSVANYADSFRTALDTYDAEGVTFSCNCILNFLYGELEGKSIGKFCGPITFGEIGYQLLNQTMAILRIH